jgi:DNA-binding NarL/FixJ family response regulator
VVSKIKIDPLVRILIVDDHKLFRYFLRGYLESVIGFSVVAEADNGNDAVDFVRKYRPHVCIMDITLKGLDGFEATKKIVTQTNKTRVLAISASTKLDSIRRMINVGAKGYLFKDSDPDVLIGAVRAVAAGLNYFPSECREPTCAPRGKKEPLSPREIQFMRLLCSNYTLNDIATELNIAYSTVYGFRTRAMAKTGAHTIADLVRYAIKNGIAL